MAGDSGRLPGNYLRSNLVLNFLDAINASKNAAIADGSPLL